MNLDLIYLSSEKGLVKKEGVNFGKEYFIHKYMYNCEIIDIFEFADSDGKYRIYDSLCDLNLQYLDKCEGVFDIFVSNGKLQLKLLNIK